MGRAQPRHFASAAFHLRGILVELGLAVLSFLFMGGSLGSGLERGMVDLVSLLDVDRLEALAAAGPSPAASHHQGKARGTHDPGPGHAWEEVFHLGREHDYPFEESRARIWARKVALWRR
jgi:hypothetical protein